MLELMYKIRDKQLLASHGNFYTSLLTGERVAGNPASRKEASENQERRANRPNISPGPTLNLGWI